MPPGQLPPVDAFWSLTTYEGVTRLMGENAMGRYSIGDRTRGLERNEDGSLTMHIQHDDPGDERPTSWLPAPQGGFYVTGRLDMPRKSVQ
ncbi:MAG: DUF1214 domain-containing protein, partial [Gemmatimonadota bacterium]